MVQTGINLVLIFRMLDHIHMSDCYRGHCPWYYETSEYHERQCSSTCQRFASESAGAEGKDEISQLDRTFHTMAQSLKEATNKERAILQNAGDVDLLNW